MATCLCRVADAANLSGSAVLTHAGMQRPARALQELESPLAAMMGCLHALQWLQAKEARLQHELELDELRAEARKEWVSSGI